jgi:hypothetical protein
MIISLVERLQPSLAASQSPLEAWRQVMARLAAEWKAGRAPDPAAMIGWVAALPEPVRAEATEELACSHLWLSWQEAPGLRARPLWEGLRPASTDPPPTSLVVEEFRARHRWPHGDGPGLDDFIRCFPDVPDVPARLHDVMRGSGRYVLVSLLGVGAHARVWEACDTRTRRPVALKELRPEAGADSHRRESLLRELDVHRQLSHRQLSQGGCLPVLDACPEARPPFFTTPLLRGLRFVDLLTAVHRPPPTQSQKEGRALRRRLLAALADVADSLTPVHALGVLHRDLTPSNLFLADDTRPYILDWGCAATPAFPPRPGETAGTPGYMAPEPPDGTPDHRRDLYSLGAILHEILTGHPPANPGPDTTLDAPAPLARLCRQCLSPLPADRPADAAAFAARLREASDHAFLPVWRRLGRGWRGLRPPDRAAEIDRGPAGSAAPSTSPARSRTGCENQC